MGFRNLHPLGNFVPGEAGCIGVDFRIRGRQGWREVSFAYVTLPNRYVAVAIGQFVFSNGFHPPLISLFLASALKWLIHGRISSINARPCI
jgi:hypothetical protein